MTAATPAPVPIYLCGSKPGVFDPTQPSRLLRHPDSTLLFASFNPLNFRGPYLSTDALTRARHIVVEVPQANDFSERPNCFSFVPNAVLAPGVLSEGKWPRVVNYCGRWVVCDQDQWDIHKLDPVYDCFVPTAGMHPTITKKIPVRFPGDDAQTRPEKRELSPESDGPPFHASKKARGAAAPYAECPEGHGYPDIPIDETTSATSSTFTAPASSGSFASFGSLATSQSNGSLMSLASLASPAALESSLLSSSNFPDAPGAYPGKCKAFHSTGSDESSSMDTGRPQKRPCEAAPATSKAEFQKRAQRKRERNREREAKVVEDLAMRDRNNQFWAEISATVVKNIEGSHHDQPRVSQPPPTAQPEPEGPTPHASASSAASAPEAVPAASGQPAPASRPSGQPASQSTPNLDLSVTSHGDARQTVHGEPSVEDLAIQLACRQAQVAMDVRRQACAVHARLEPGRHQPRQEHREQWMPWTPQRAIDRYLALSPQFDGTRFSHDNPVDVLFVPWPILHSPFTFHVGQVNWEMVEAFFEEAARQMDFEDYRAFVVESHRRFHPDRWHSRSVFRTYDNEHAQALERACTIISQALTPIWSAIRIL